MKLSIVTPFYNESEVVSLYFEKLAAVLEPWDDIEWVAVNDGSTDDTLELLKAQVDKRSGVKAVELSRNFGKEAALTAGLSEATGDAIIIIDADLQDPPEIIPEMIKQWQDGYDVVAGRRVDRSTDSWVKRKTAQNFYRIFNHFSDDPIPEDVGDFRLIDRKVLDVLNLMPEKNRFMKGLLSWPGFRVAFVDFERDERVAGETKWNYSKLFLLACDGIFAFSVAPLRISFFLGFLASTFGLIYAVYLISKTIIQGVDLPGYASLMVVVLTFSGLILICLGVIGEYLGRVYKEVKARPVFVIKDVHSK